MSFDARKISLTFSPCNPLNNAGMNPFHKRRKWVSVKLGVSASFTQSSMALSPKEPRAGFGPDVHRDKHPPAYFNKIWTIDCGLKRQLNGYITRG